MSSEPSKTSQTGQDDSGQPIDLNKKLQEAKEKAQIKEQSEGTARARDEREQSSSANERVSWAPQSEPTKKQSGFASPSEV